MEKMKTGRVQQKRKRKIMKLIQSLNQVSVGKVKSFVIHSHLKVFNPLTNNNESLLYNLLRVNSHSKML